MNKAFVRESDDDDEENLSPSLKLPAGTRNYISPAGHDRLKDELEHLVKRERPHVVEVVAWAASNGDRSENGDYIYGKRRLREIDRRIRFLTKRIECAEIVDPLLWCPGNDSGCRRNRKHLHNRWRGRNRCLKRAYQLDFSFGASPDQVARG